LGTLPKRAGLRLARLPYPSPGFDDPTATGQASTMAVLRHLEWMRLRGLSADTVYHRRRGLVRLADALPVPLLAADAAMLADWRKGLSVGDEAVGSYVSDARQFYAWAVGEHLLEENPAARLVTPKVGRRLPRPIGESALYAALVGAPERIRPWLVLAGWAGLRAKEIALLRRECVMDTLAAPVLLIAADATKGRNERIVPMCAFVLAALCEYGLPGSGWMFRRRDGRPGPNQPWMVSHLANEYLHSAGIAETLHQLRHRFGTETYRATKDLRVVQELMGHASPKTAAGYAAFANGSAIAAVDALPVPPGTD
jgi:site-specific recombinase XerD